MSEATTRLTPAGFGRVPAPAGLIGRIGALVATIAEAVAEAQAMRQEAMRRYPYLSGDA